MKRITLQQKCAQKRVRSHKVGNITYVPRNHNGILFMFPESIDVTKLELVGYNCGDDVLTESTMELKHFHNIQYIGQSMSPIKGKWFIQAIGRNDYDAKNTVLTLKLVN